MRVIKEAKKRETDAHIYYQMARNKQRNKKWPTKLTENGTEMWDKCKETNPQDVAHLFNSCFAEIAEWFIKNMIIESHNFK
jgi:hypothetical protein